MKKVKFTRDELTIMHQALISIPDLIGVFLDQNNKVISDQARIDAIKKVETLIKIINR